MSSRSSKKVAIAGTVRTSTSTTQPFLEWHRYRAPYLQRLRVRLELMLGGRCAVCGALSCHLPGGTALLEFHHEHGRDYESRRLSWGQRLLRYRKEIKEGKIKELLCGGENGCHQAITKRQVVRPF